LTRRPTSVATGEVFFAGVAGAVGAAARRGGRRDAGRRPFRFPVCVFYFTMTDDQGYYSRAYESFVPTGGKPTLTIHAVAHSEKLSNESLEVIVAAVMRW
jgi:hypothetical protein